MPIVEGHSEAASMPAFMRRILHDLGIFDVQPDTKPVREKRQRLADPKVFTQRIRMAQNKPDCSAIIAILDADDDAACVLGPALAKATVEAGVCVPCRVVIAVREIEAWLLAGIESLRGVRGVRKDAERPVGVESIRGAKQRLHSLMTSGYKPTIDLGPLLMKFDYVSARAHSRSLDRFLRIVEQLARDAGMREWP